MFPLVPLTYLLVLLAHLCSNMRSVGAKSFAGPGSGSQGEGDPSMLKIKLVIFADRSLQKHLAENLHLPQERHRAFFAAYVRQIESNFAQLQTSRIERIRFELIDVVEHEQNSTLISTGDIDLLLDNFCQHQANLRSAKGARPDWHLSLLLTAQDLFSPEDGEDAPATLGVSLLSGIHWPELACLIVEFGVNYEQKVSANGSKKHTDNPSRGFSSTWAAAHEIGHSLGLHHDGLPFNPSCNSTDSAMSPSSYALTIRPQWSACSIESLIQLETALIGRLGAEGSARSDGAEIWQLPGETFDLRAQCKAFASGLEVSPTFLNKSICNQTAWCVDGQRGHFVAIGPALDGTECYFESGSGRCFEGMCAGPAKLRWWDGQHVSPT